MPKLQAINRRNSVQHNITIPTDLVLDLEWEKGDNIHMEVPRHWRLNKQRYAMVGETCSECSSLVFPPRAVCPHCGAGKPEVKQQKAVFTLETIQPMHIVPVAIRK